jgi:cell division protein YceG involved in septum cleavage
MLFQKDLKIEQAMYRLYQQIDTKGLYFFCLQEVKEKTKYIRIQPGSTIEQIYNRYGRDDFLILIYGNGEMGLEGLKKMEKCMIILLIVIAGIWVALYAYKYFMINSDNSDPQTEQIAQP